MTDIVERLRCEGNSYRDVCNALGTADVMEEAADEIERLRGKLATISLITSPGNRTLDEMMRDMGMACDMARAALAQKETPP